MTEIGKDARVIVVGVLAFGFLGFYIWYAFEGLGLLATCMREAGSVKVPVPTCQRDGLMLGNALDLFSPVSGVVTAVALSALAYKPDAVGNVAASLNATFLKTYSLLDTMIVLFLLGWAGVGLTISFQTADLSLALAKEWNLQWLHGVGRTWWATALTAVALWLGVPKSAPNPGGNPVPKPNPIA